MAHGPPVRGPSWAQQRNQANFIRSLNKILRLGQQGPSKRGSKGFAHVLQLALNICARRDVLPIQPGGFMMDKATMIIAGNG